MTALERTGTSERETYMVPSDSRFVRRSRGMDQAALLQAKLAACFVHRCDRVVTLHFPIPSGDP
jgi:hypothetical protein